MKTSQQEYNKLVRDKIPQIVETEHSVPETEILAGANFVRELERKLLEECHELFEADETKDKAEEIADILEVLRALADAEEICWDAIENVRLKKKEERGAFEKRVFLKSIERK